MILTVLDISMMSMFTAGGSKCVDEDMCAEEKCVNGATCKDLEGEGAYKCTCVPGYNGYNCQHNIDECASSPCKNGATCNDMVNKYNCTCPSGFTGECQHTMTQSKDTYMYVFEIKMF